MKSSVPVFVAVLSIAFCMSAAARSLKQDGFTGCAAVLCPANATEYRCVIYIDGGRVKTQTFSDPCLASCSIDPQYVLGSYKGKCSRSADGACARSVVAGETYCVSSSAGTAEYPSTCYAEKLGCPRGGCTKYSGQCIEKEAEALFASAPCLGTTVNCLVDPCRGATCPNNPTAICQSSYCTIWFRDVLVNPYPPSCQAVFLDPTSGNIEFNCEPVLVIDPPYEKPKGHKGKSG